MESVSGEPAVDQCFVVGTIDLSKSDLKRTVVSNSERKCTWSRVSWGQASFLELESMTDLDLSWNNFKLLPDDLARLSRLERLAATYVQRQDIE